MNINLTAPLNKLGYGVVGLNALLSLSKAGHEVAWWPIGPKEYPPQHDSVVKAAQERCRFFDPKAPSLRVWQQFDLAQHVGKGLHASLVYFERDKLYDSELHHLLAQDIIIASSQWMKQTLVVNGVPEERVRIARPGVDTSIFKPAFHPRKADGLTVFMCVGKWELRKGHDVVIRAFERAFTENDNVTLVMLTENPFLKPHERQGWHNRYENSTLAKKVQIIPARLPSQKELAHFMSYADCGVFVSRAEGWNLDLAEMMAMGKHVIATNFSAHTEFVTSENARLVEIDELEDAFDGKWFFGHGKWAKLGERQIDQVAEHMRAVHKAKQEGSLAPNQAGMDTMKTLTWDNFAKEVVDALV